VLLKLFFTLEKIASNIKKFTINIFKTMRNKSDLKDNIMLTETLRFSPA